MSKIYIVSQRIPLSAVLSISSDLVVQLDSSQRIIFANEPFLKFVGTDSKNLLGKNIEYTPVATAFDETFAGFLERLQQGIAGKEWSGEIEFSTADVIVFCRIAPTVFEDGRKGVSVILEDITDRKLAEQALQESEAKLRSITENIPDLILMLDPNLIIRFISRTYTLNSEDVCGKSVYDFVPKKFHPAASRCFTCVLETGEPAKYDTEYYFADGKTVYFESTVGPIFQDGKVSALVLNAHDITERKKAEDALRESEERYRQLVEISPDAVIIHQTGKIIYLNPAALIMLGVKDSNEILGTNVLDLIHPDFRDTVRKNIEKDLNGEITPPTELDLLRVDGTMVVVEGRGVKTTFNGKPAVQVAIRDITKYRQIEEKLRESENKYRSIIDRANDGICVVQDNVIKMCNRRAAEFWGDSIENTVGRVFTDFIHPDALSDVVDRYHRRMAGEKLPEMYETILMRKDGGKFYAELNASIISYEGKPADLAIIRDINERKKAEDAFRVTKISEDLTLLVSK
jgi:PAS domain S-box-containing protein